MHQHDVAQIYHGATTELLARAIARHVHNAGDRGTALPALSLHRRDAPTELVQQEIKDGYNYFGRHPEKVIAFFDKYMTSSAGATRQKAATGARVSV